MNPHNTLALNLENMSFRSQRQTKLKNVIDKIELTLRARVVLDDALNFVQGLQAAVSLGEKHGVQPPGSAARGVEEGTTPQDSQP